MRKIHLGNLSGYILQKLDFFNRFSDINILIFNVKDYMDIRNLLAGIQENIVSFRVIKHDSFIREIRNTEIDKLGLCLYIFFITDWKEDFFQKESDGSDCSPTNSPGMFLVDYIDYVKYFCISDSEFLCRLLTDIRF